jgi:phospholipid-binding lipoprotein MlaA
MLALRPAIIALGSLVVLGLAACATPPPASDPDAVADYQEANDPLEPTNRVFYAINNGLDTVILRPLAIAYRDGLPLPVRTHVHDVLSNLAEPVQLADNILQTKPRTAGNTLMRFMINSTVGIGGIFDVATDWGYPERGTDAGVTLALWGLPDGPFLFLPFLGPSSPRDATGFGMDVGLDPFTYVGQGTAVTALKWSRFGVSAIDLRAAALADIDQIKKTALDPYATFRSLYRQHRASVIEDSRHDLPATVPAWFPQPAAPR